MEQKNLELESIKYNSIILNNRELCDFELIVNGGFSPLKGYMNKNDYLECVNNMRLKNGKLWSMPITLSINEKKMNELKHSDYVVLKHETGLPLGLMNISNDDSIFEYDLKKECENVYGGYDLNHPYVKILDNNFQNGRVYYIGGEIELWKIPPHYDFIEERLTPKETIEYFRKNGWSKIVGFQTRNPMHRSHYELTKYALKVAGRHSRLFLNPVVGITQDCDINYHTRVKCYKKLLNYYNKNDVLLGLLPLSMRMAGPREAVWHAQIRKNYGCTHFVVGRDHAGPSYKRQDGTDFYDPYDAQNLLLKHAEEIGIIPIISKMIVYALQKGQDDVMKGEYMPIDKVDEEKYLVMKISGTEQRRMLNNGDKIPDWFTFPLIEEELKKSYTGLSEQGFTLYFVGLSGSGKSTIANFVISKLRELTNRKISYYDGDIIRLNLSQGLGFNKRDRSINVRRIGFVCAETTKHGGIAVAANIAPFKEDREYNREKISKEGNYIEIFVDTDIDECEKRDVKGFYKLAKEGILKDFTGISSRFDRADNAEIVLKSDNSIEENVNKIIDYLKDKRLI